MDRKFTAHKPKAAPPAPRDPPTAPRLVTKAAMEKSRSEKIKAPAGQVVWPKEIGGPEGPEPTRYGDWERNGICSDF